MASSYPAPISAIQVGSYFAQQYYQVLQQQPDFSHQFYNENSYVVRVDKDIPQVVNGLQAIHDLIISETFSGIKIRTINSVESWKEGVLVVVSGTVKPRGSSGWKSFVQTFLLAPQEKGYFVLNDIFHYVNDEVVGHHPPNLVPENKDESQPSVSSPFPDKSASNFTLEADAGNYVNPGHLEDEEEKDFALEGSPDEHHEEYQEEHEDEHEEEPEEEHQEEHDPKDEIAEEGIPLQDSFAPVQAAADAISEPQPVYEEPIEAPQKFTYASILRAPKGKFAAAISSQMASRPHQRTSDWAHTSPPAAQQSNVSLALQESALDSVDEALSLEEGETRSVYLKRLPSTVLTIDILQEFKHFGKIKQDGVFVGTSKDGMNRFAFVEFEDAQSAQNAVKASPVLLHDKPVHIEERRSSSTSSTRGGRGRGRGRGGRFGTWREGWGSYQDGSARDNGFRS